MNLHTKWLLYSITGLLLIGFGLSLFGEAVIAKMNAAHWQDWFWIGTISLVVINTGLSFIGQAVIFKVQKKRAYRK